MSPAPPISFGASAPISDRIADETFRIYWPVRWRGPLGCISSGVLMLALLRNQIASEALGIWVTAVMIAGIFMTISFAVPALRDQRAATGLPMLAKPAHVLAGAALGSMLWLDPSAADRPLAWWPIVTLQLAVTAGAAAGVAGLGYTMAVSMWVQTSCALFIHGEHVMGSATAVFLLMVVGFQRQSGEMWRELVSLRMREADLSATNAHRATHDELTGLLNRRGLTVTLSGDHVYQSAMFIDLDHFKQVNDRFGHTAGDTVLRQAAARLRATVRGGDVIARIGGDEFFVVFEEILTEERAAELGQTIIDTLEEPFTIAGHGDVWISASVGYTSMAPAEIQASRLLTEADHAMLHAKRQGRRQVAGFTETLHAQLSERSGLESTLRQAIRTRRIDAAAQPIYELSSQTVHAVELLARWTLDSGNQVPPSLFIPLAEEVGLIDDLTQIMLDHAGQAFARWAHEPSLMEARITINVSPRQIVGGNLLGMVSEAIDRYGIEPGQLVLELTESATLSEMRSTVDLFNDLRDLGVLLAIDDFGTGYSSLGHLLSLPVAAVKIDRSLIANLGVDPRHRAVMQAVRDLAEVLGQEVVAEGIENDAQLEALLEMGIRCGQGFGLCRPVPVEDLVDQLAITMPLAADKVHGAPSG